MNIAEVTSFTHHFWQDEIIPQLVEYIKIPNKSPAFDANWKQNGHMDKALKLAVDWIKLHAEDDWKLYSFQSGERTPIIYITGSSSLKRQGSGGFKEIDDVSIAAPLTKYSASITDGSRIREFVDKAYRIATNGYPGAVHLSLPVDIMFSSFPEDAGLEERPFSHKAKPIAKAWPDPNSISEILELASNSKKPILIGGHGIWWSHSEKKLENAGNSLNIPIFNILNTWTKHRMYANWSNLIRYFS